MFPTGFFPFENILTSHTPPPPQNPHFASSSSFVFNPSPSVPSPNFNPFSFQPRGPPPPPPSHTQQHRGVISLPLVESNAESKVSHIVILLDKSESMRNLRVAIVSSINKFIKSQQELKNISPDGKEEEVVEVTFTQFNDKIIPIHHRKSLKDFPLFTEQQYDVSDSTALYDAMGLTIDQFSNCSNVIMAVVTDGAENQSRIYTQKTISEKIKQMKEKQNWNILYLSSDPTAVEQAKDIGVHQCYSSTRGALAQSIEQPLSFGVSNARSANFSNRYSS